MVPTSQAKSWAYAPVGGTFNITGASMPAQAASWAKLTLLPTDASAGYFLQATHGCAYQCYTSQFTGDANNGE
jgi:hypothetical protein